VVDDALTAIEVAWNGLTRGRVLLRDGIRADAAEAVRALRQAGIDCVLVAGDRLEAARAVADQVGIEHVEAPRWPEEKIEAIRAAQHAAGGTATRRCVAVQSPMSCTATQQRVAVPPCERAVRAGGRTDAVAMVISSLTVLANSLRIQGFRDG
jgi:cation transport ATPase